MVQSRRRITFRRLRSLAELHAQVILFGLYDFFAIDVYYLRKKLKMGRFPLEGDSVFLFSNDVSTLVSSDEAAPKQFSGWFPSMGNSIFDFLLTVCLMKAMNALYHMFL